MTTYRQAQQVKELEGFVLDGRGVEMHPVRDLYGSGWGDPYTVPHLQPVRVALEEAVSTAEHVLEIGCGGGRWTQVIAASKPEGSQLLVTDDTPHAFANTDKWLASQELPPIDGSMLCPTGDLGDFANETDVAFSFDVFVHFELPLMTAYLESIARVLKPGGKLLINFACDFSGHPDWIRSDRWFEYVMEYDGGYHFRPKIQRLLEQWFHMPTDDEIHAMPVGYGSAFMVLRRSD